MRRIAIAGAMLAASLAVWWGTGFAPKLGAPPATLSDCVAIKVWNNGFHTSLSLPAEALAPTHPLRQLYPDARYLLVGWGDSAFYRSDGRDLILGLWALAPGGATTVHVLGAQAPPEQTFLPKNVQAVAISKAGAQQLGARLEKSLALDAEGRVQFLAKGQAPGRSMFLKGGDHFHLFQVCNQWTARSLRAAGVPVNAAFVYTGDQLVAALRASAPSTCPER
jgi:uncharacterized protein (TIGR02117 family)